MYVCNKTFYSFEIAGVQIERGKAVEVTSAQKNAIETSPMLQYELNRGFVWFADTVPEEFKSANQQLTDTKKQLEETKNEAKTVIASKEDEIAKQKKEIARLKAELAKLKKEV